MTNAKPSATPDPEVIYVSTHRVACNGGGGALGHPVVWYSLEDGEAVCGYSFTNRMRPAKGRRGSNQAENDFSQPSAGLAAGEAPDFARFRRRRLQNGLAEDAAHDAHQDNRKGEHQRRGAENFP